MTGYGGFGNGGGKKPNSYRPTPLPSTSTPRYRKGGGLLGSLLGAAAVSTESGAMLPQREQQIAGQQREIEEKLRLQRLAIQKQREMEEQLFQQNTNIQQPQPQMQRQPMPTHTQMQRQNDDILPNGRRVCKNCGMIVTGNFCEYCGSAL